MACEVINSWTFIGLVGAFLDLFIAYILLCGSTVVYSASKILGFFGLTLPCPCNGLFGIANNDFCIQSMLVNEPAARISSIQSSSMKKVPFDSILNSFYDGEEEEEDDEELDSQPNFEKWENGNNVEITGGEASSSSWNEKKEIVDQDNNKKGSSFGSINPNKGSRVGFRRRKRASHLYDPLVVGLSSSASGVGVKLGTPPASGTDVNSEDGKENLKDTEWLKQGSHGFETDDDPYDLTKKELALAKSEGGGHKTALKVLEQALDKEHEGRTALYLELEKERTAAASAADEAMAMILRLQEEKAAIEMEARQYQRMIEEKTAFDSEEMNILKEILLRRETEKLFLEKEVEAYKQMFFEKEQDDTSMYDMAALQEQRTSNEEPVPMLQQIPISVGEKNGITFFEPPNQSLEKKGMPSDKNLNHKDGHVETNESTTDSYKKACNPTVEEKCSEKMEKHAEALRASNSGINLNVHDVHVINEECENKRDGKLITPTSNSPKTCDNPITGGSETEPGKKRNGLERSGGLPPIGPSGNKSLPPLSRRNSMSASDYERFKIENEVGLLRERLRILQQGRENISIPAGSKEREQTQSQIMENIASQLREIRQLSEPGKALQQASLPPPSSKAKSKKKDRRRASLGGMRSI